MNTPITRVAAVGGPVASQHRARLDRQIPSPQRNAAYRRLAVAILGLDVPTMAVELRSTTPRRHARAA